jgi:hypothetical protein
MADSDPKRPTPNEQATTPSRAAFARRLAQKGVYVPPTHDPAEPAVPSGTRRAPWELEQYFDGEIDLDKELASRYPNMPLMSLVNFRALGTRDRRAVALLSTQDSAASLRIEVDQKSRGMHLVFTLSSMLSLRFRMEGQSEKDRAAWLEAMRREQGETAFLWGARRWEADYMVCAARRHFTNLYAFSPGSFEAAARLTADVGRRVLDWLDQFWQGEQVEDADSTTLTW